jgi:2-haloacid dehalogenase
MASNEQVVLAFDAYGTLLSTESISKQLAEHSNEDTAAKVSQQWRRYQLEYTWRLNSMSMVLLLDYLCHFECPNPSAKPVLSYN